MENAQNLPGKVRRISFDVKKLFSSDIKGNSFDREVIKEKCNCYRKQ